jgi:hypothetical protein
MFSGYTIIELQHKRKVKVLLIRLIIAQEVKYGMV